MTLSKSRKAICFILTLLIAAGSILLFGISITKSTVLSQKYMNYVFDKCNVSEQCEKAFKDQISVLEAQSGIPSRVFDAVYKNNDISNSSALTRLYNQDNPDLYSKNQIAQFDSLCKEYLKGNNMQYDEALIHNTAVKATQAYSDCFGLKNTEAIADFISTFNSNYLHFLSIGILLVALPIILLLVLFNIFVAFTVTGFTFTAAGIASLIAKISQGLNISPQIYQTAFTSAVNGACCVCIVLGVLLAAISVFANVKITKSLDSK